MIASSGKFVLTMVWTGSMVILLWSISFPAAAVGGGAPVVTVPHGLPTFPAPTDYLYLGIELLAFPLAALVGSRRSSATRGRDSSITPWVAAVVVAGVTAYVFTFYESVFGDTLPWSNYDPIDHDAWVWFNRGVVLVVMAAVGFVGVGYYPRATALFSGVIAGPILYALVLGIRAGVASVLLFLGPPVVIVATAVAYLSTLGRRSRALSITYIVAIGGALGMWTQTWALVLEGFST